MGGLLAYIAASGVLDIEVKSEPITGAGPEDAERARTAVHRTITRID